MPKQLHVFGIRHHGPGSARAALRALETVRPQCVLVEGPPDADEVIAWATHDDMRPPIALLIYQADDASRAVFYPFAEFSPEWCAIRWALQHDVPVRFMDLPQSHRLPEQNKPADGETPESPLPESTLRTDPFRLLAHAAGFDDGERWWEHAFEHRRHADLEVFTAIREAMAALREAPDAPALAPHVDRDEPLREAWMRRTIRAAQREFDHVAVICGAWHVPALRDETLKSLKKEDDEKLRPLTKVKTVATWIPWTYDRLSAAGGYGAGVHSPGWYEHLWRHDSLVLERWMTAVGRLLREKDLDCSSAHVIEATRLANSLAAIRDRPLADLSDIGDACRAVFCFDSDLAMRLISRKLLIGERLGEVPEEIPLAPLQHDLQRRQKRLRLKPEALEKTLDLDLRNDTDLARSELLHQLRVLGVAWGTPEEARSGKGTFHEIWRLRWEPAFLVRLIELGVWGSTVEAAASGFARHAADEATSLEQLTHLLEDVLLANLPEALQTLMDRILAAAAVAADVVNLMEALPPLAKVYRYGDVRRTDKTLVRRAIDAVLPRINVGLGGAVSSLNDEAAREMERRIVQVHEAVQLLESPAESEAYGACLARIADQAAVHCLLRGRCTRLLFDYGTFQSEDVARRLSLMLSRGGDPAQAAAWVEGFLSSSGLVLLHHADLLALIDQWMGSIPVEAFNEQMPLLRRTFATFAPAERRQIGDRVRDGGRKTAARGATAPEELHLARAARVTPILRAIFGTTPDGGAA